MKVTIYYPQHKFLKKYINFFYVLELPNEPADTKSWVYPHIYSTVSIRQYSRIIQREKQCSFIEYDPKNPIIDSRLNYKSVQARSLSYKGPVLEIATVFQPLGINAFLPEQLSHYSQNEDFSPFFPYSDYIQEMEKLFAFRQPSKKIKFLENYWLKKFIGFEHDFLHLAIDQIFTGTFDIESFVKEAGISRKTLIAHFVNHLGKTPSQFRKVLRFRRAIAMRLNGPDRFKLTSIAHELDYYDQSHLIREFKALTDSSPKRFFKEISLIGNGAISWKIE